jgi:hypothetical protein
MDEKDRKIQSLEDSVAQCHFLIAGKDKEIERAKGEYQRSENERGAEKRAYQWVIESLAETLKS